MEKNASVVELCLVSVTDSQLPAAAAVSHQKGCRRGAHTSRIACISLQNQNIQPEVNIHASHLFSFNKTTAVVRSPVQFPES